MLKGTLALLCSWVLTRLQMFESLLQLAQSYVNNDNNRTWPHRKYSYLALDVHRIKLLLSTRLILAMLILTFLLSVHK